MPLTRLPLEVERRLALRLPLPGHGAPLLPDVLVESYTVAFQQKGRFIGDQAARRVFFERIDAWRATVRRRGDDPFGDTPTESLSKKNLDKVLRRGDPAAAGIIQAAIDDFARALVTVIRVFHRRAWKRVTHIVVGGGFRGSRIGELAIGRAQVMLHDAGMPIALEPIRHDPDEAGLVGAAYLMPRWMFGNFDALLAIDIGGTNVRCGIVCWEENTESPSVDASLLWRHSDDDATRESVLDETIGMLKRLIRTAARRHRRLAPFVGIGCPGRIRLDGSIERGTGNLPGNWQSSRFHLPTAIHKALPAIHGFAPVVVLHNDAVVQGLSMVPAMREVERWAVLTIGTGLGNAQFCNTITSPSRKHR
ncbi:ROK family protein [Tahibacter amnicola]|uniref:ROK family protein n=1 Tax=Tahibacter amnicola TaxID=2976241 RepID=A0ABY6BD90_9GAMM|nr:ROK family protein [Tahibacter amnicola]UXI66295.1 ROK family protein [Tahibacter amnicola]